MCEVLETHPVITQPHITKADRWAGSDAEKGRWRWGQTAGG